MNLNDYEIKAFDRLISMFGNAFDYISANMIFDNLLDEFVKYDLVTDLIDEKPRNFLNVFWNNHYASYGNIIKPSQVNFNIFKA
jgi:hypothetical protein